MTLLLDMWLLIISHPSVNFDCRRSLEKEFTAFLICYMTLSVCNFQSMKRPVELNSLLLKFFCYITWLVISPGQTRHWTTCKRGLYVKSYCFFETIAQRFKNYKLLCDHMINRLCDFVDNRPALEPTTLSSLIAIGLVEVKI